MSGHGGTNHSTDRLVDPIIEVRPTKGQIDDLIGEINDRIGKDERVLVTTLTKKMSEDLTDYLKEIGIKVRYLHSDIKTLNGCEYCGICGSGRSMSWLALIC